MKIKQKNISLVIIVIIVIILGLLICKMKSSATDKIVISVHYPTENTTWSFSSKQKISWSVEGLPAGNYRAALYLKNLENGQKGYISREPITNGPNELNYVVNLCKDTGENYFPLKNGDYQFGMKIYKITAGGEHTEKLVTEQNFGTITIIDSDVK